jgi:hypothetical protein
MIDLQTKSLSIVNDVPERESAKCSHFAMQQQHGVVSHYIVAPKIVARKCIRAAKLLTLTMMMI